MHPSRLTEKKVYRMAEIAACCEILFFSKWKKNTLKINTKNKSQLASVAYFKKPV